MWQPGTQIGRYEIQRKLARGGMGVVYVAHDPVLGRMVAIKVFIGDMDVPDAAERFAREARAAAALNHSNIVTVYDFGEVSSQPYIVMEYIQGETVAELISRKTPVPLTEKLRWLEDLCAGVASAHKMDVIHRDIKPSNLMVDRTSRLKVLDFGIAKIIGSLGTSMTAVIGTPGYMAPEQLLGHRIDARTDLFSIGVVAFELLTYEEAFAGETFTAITHRIIHEDVRRLSDLLPEAPRDLGALIEKSVQKNPADRFQDAESMRIAFSKVRRQLESTMNIELEPPTIVVKDVAGATTEPVPAVAGAAPQRIEASVRLAELTPPPTPAARPQADQTATRIGAALTLAQASLDSGALDDAQDACAQVLALDASHTVALDLSRQVQSALARRRASQLLVNAREALAKGALTSCRSLLDEARQLDAGARDGQLEHELRMARVEHERARLRKDASMRTIADARSALDRGDLEEAVALSREALGMDPGSDEARALESVALAQLEETTRLADTAPAPVDVESPTVVTLPRHTPRPPTQTSTQTSTTRDTTPAPRSTPATTTPGAGKAAGAPAPVSPAGRDAPPKTAAPSRPAPLTSPPRPPVAARQPSIDETPTEDAAVSARSAPVMPPPLTDSASRPAVSPPPAPAPARTTPRSRPQVDVGARLRTLGAAIAVKAALVPRRQRIAVGAVAMAALLLGAFTIAYLMRGQAAVVANGVLVIEAVPWAHVTSIRSATGESRLDAARSTPLSVPLPAGVYTVELTGPANEKRAINVDVQADRVTVTPAVQFRTLTVDEYFGRYFPGFSSTPAAPPPSTAGAAGAPSAPASPSSGDSSAGTVPSGGVR